MAAPLWQRGEDVQVEAESLARREITVVHESGVRVEGLTVAEVAELLRRLS